MIYTYNTDNMLYPKEWNHIVPKGGFDIIFADYVYENLDFSWVDKYFDMLKVGGVMIAMSDFHSDYRYRVHMEDKLGASFINDAKWKCEWGNHRKDRFHQCFDSIMIYTNVNKGWKFYPERIQIPKATAKTKLNPSGRETKTATAWIDDIVLTTTAKERVHNPNTNKLIRWQKPLRLYDRIISAFSDESDWVIDPFMGSGSLGRWCKLNNRNYIGIEYDKEVFDLAEENINGR